MLFYNSLLQIYEEFAEYALSFRVFFSHTLHLCLRYLGLHNCNITRCEYLHNHQKNVSLQVNDITTR